MELLVLGANSDMAKAIAYAFAKQGFNLSLAARNTELLQPLKSDLEIKHEVNVALHHFDALDYDSHASFYANVTTPDVVVCAFGYLGEQAIALNNFEEASLIMDTNYKGAVSILNVVANDFESRKQGTIIGISSVAGERGRQSNYIYGSAKAAFSTYLDGMRNRLFSAGAHVVTVKPGFVRTKMLGDMDTPAPLTASPQQVANAIYKAYRSKKNTLYVNSKWRLIMWIIRNIPEFMFKKKNL